MRRRLTKAGRSIAGFAVRAATATRGRLRSVGELWRHSLQFRVTVSTLALSSTVVFVLGMVLQNQITDRLIDTKREAAIAQTRRVLNTAEQQLAKGDPTGQDAMAERLKNALSALTSTAPASTDAQSSAAGAFEPVLAAGGRDRLPEDTPAAGDYWKVPERLRSFVQQGRLSWQIHTAGTGGERATYMVIGAPVTSTVQPVHLYLLFPLTAEQNTVATVQNTLLVGCAVLLILLAAIANLVTRQVVRPVRGAAAAAEQFADGDLDKRLQVVGEDDLATLAVSYNEMAASIQDQIHQLEEFGRLQRRFTSDVSHELRTPLTTVRMAADVLHASREQFPAGLARSTELLVDELDRFEALLRDLLEISRLDAGVEELATEPVDLRPIVERVIEQVGGLTGSTGSTVEVDQPSEEAIAEVDPRRVERILRNLLSNAVDHSEGEPVRVRIAADDAAVAVTVRDYGVGLRPGEAELVFNRFWRADPSRNRRTGGTGLGLAIAHEDARLHGGTLEAWGEPGQGACFRLAVPRKLGEPFEHSPLDLPPDRPRIGTPQLAVAAPEPGGQASEQAGPESPETATGPSSNGTRAAEQHPEEVR